MSDNVLVTHLIELRTTLDNWKYVSGFNDIDIKFEERLLNIINNIQNDYANTQALHTEKPEDTYAAPDDSAPEESEPSASQPHNIIDEFRRQQSQYEAAHNTGGAGQENTGLQTEIPAEMEKEYTQRQEEYAQRQEEFQKLENGDEETPEVEVHEVGGPPEGTTIVDPVTGSVTIMNSKGKVIKVIKRVTENADKPQEEILS